MRFNSVIISSFFVSVVLADSFSTGATLTLKDENATMQCVSSIIHVPDMASQKPGSVATPSVAIDLPNSCSNTVYLGVVCQVGKNGEGPSYTVVYAYDNMARPFPGIDVKAGDKIQLLADAYLMQGFVTVVNLSNYQNVTHSFNLTEGLCGKTASWLVQVSDVSVNLGTLTFAKPEASGNDFKQTDLKYIDTATEDGKPLTNVSADSVGSITVTWL